MTARHFGLAVLALAMGGFAIGTTEFVTMGLLPQISGGVDVSIPTGGHVISAYAVGVVVGAPVLAFLGARLPRRGLLVALMAAFAVGNGLSALATSYEQLMVARFAAGLPHGAYFGVASLVAASMARPSRKGRAVSQVMLGLSVANVIGVPAATVLGQELGWRAAFWAAGGLAVVTLASSRGSCRRAPATPGASGRRELAAFTGAAGVADPARRRGRLRRHVRRLLLHRPRRHRRGRAGGAVGRRSSCCPSASAWSPAPGSPASWPTGRSSARSIIGGVGMAATMLAFWVAAPHGWAALPVVFLITMLGSVLVVNLQLRLMDVAGDAQTLGAAMNHASLNIANALGAWLGGLVIAAGWGLRAPALVGLGLSLAGVAILLFSAALHVRRRDAVPA